VACLYAALPQEQQARVFEPAEPGTRKVWLGLHFTTDFYPLLPVVFIVVVRLCIITIVVILGPVLMFIVVGPALGTPVIAVVCLSVIHRLGPALVVTFSTQLMTHGCEMYLHSLSLSPLTSAGGNSIFLYQTAYSYPYNRMSNLM
jgi:hypothetical protein